MTPERSGFFDGLRGNVVSGWAVDGGEPASIDLYVDGERVGRTIANRYRADLGTTLGNAHCAFTISIPLRFCDGRNHAVELVFGGTSRHLEHGQIDFLYDFVSTPQATLVVPDPKLAVRAKTVLNLLRPMDVVGRDLVRIGRANDGGYVMVDQSCDGRICYSIGISEDVSWDLQMAEKGAQIFQYDHTIAGLPEQHPSFHWWKVGVAAASEPGGGMLSLRDMLKSNGHEKTQGVILKIDVEGYEWEVFESVDEGTLSQFGQILLEIHAMRNIQYDDIYKKMVGCFEKINRTHQLFHVHANNCGPLVLIGGVPIPDTFEVSYVRREGLAFAACGKEFPTPIDQPCSPAIADCYLGFMGLERDPS